MQVVRDTAWKAFLDDAMKMYRLKTPNDKCYKLADATWRFKKRHEIIKNEREKTKIVVLDKPPNLVARESQTHQKLCKAITMTGKPCSFKAVCGDHCRKHSNSLNKLNVSDITKQLNEIKINI